LDKLGAAERREALAMIYRTTGLDADQVVATSAHTGEGRTEIAEAMMSLLDAPAWREPAP
jgi:GTP-binding protein